MLLLSPHYVSRLRCPVCRATLRVGTDTLQCAGAACGATFPLVNGTPILINERSSVFAIDDFTSRRKTYFDPHHDSRAWRAKVARVLYENSIDLKGPTLIARFADAVVASGAAPYRVLVLGAGTDVASLGSLASRPDFDLLLTDVALGDTIRIVCDGHDIPFEDATFDAVIVQAVLEHVADPERCVDEIHRVLKDDGVVYSDVPFMQQVHGGAYDFTRYTHLGHRRLFRRFEEIESGASGGPGAALTWSYRYFLLSCVDSRFGTRLMRLIAKLTSFWLKYLDRVLIDRSAALDAASSTYFIGRRSRSVLSDREIVRAYRGSVGRF